MGEAVGSGGIRQTNIGTIRTLCFGMVQGSGLDFTELLAMSLAVVHGLYFACGLVLVLQLGSGAFGVIVHVYLVPG
ncbi:hypothetical protein V6N13_108570 [Hibiscus sabdariffa]